MVYAIYEDFFPEVEKKLNRVAKKCVKHGNDFTFEVKGEEIREKFNAELNRNIISSFLSKSMAMQRLITGSVSQFWKSISVVTLSAESILRLTFQSGLRQVEIFVSIAILKDIETICMLSITLKLTSGNRLAVTV